MSSCKYHHTDVRLWTICPRIFSTHWVFVLEIGRSKVSNNKWNLSSKKLVNFCPETSVWPSHMIMCVYVYMCVTWKIFRHSITHHIHMSSSSSLSSSSSSSGSRKKKKKFIGIVKLDLTYGKNTMGPPQFHRVPGNVNRNSEQDFDDSVFVW